MQIEDYFDFQRPDDIRIRGHRIGIETILTAYLAGVSPEAIQQRYPTLSLEQVYATITYYLGHKREVDAYLDDYRAHYEEGRRRFYEDPPPVVRRLLEGRGDAGGATAAP